MAAKAETPQTGTSRSDVSNARATAISALTNSRFGAVLDRLASPHLSDALMQVKSAGSGASLGAAQASYAASSD